MAKMSMPLIGLLLGAGDETGPLKQISVTDNPQTIFRPRVLSGPLSTAHHPGVMENNDSRHILHPLLWTLGK